MEHSLDPNQSVKDLLSEKVQRALLAHASGEASDEDTVDLLGDVALIVQRFANAGLLEFMYLPPGSDDDESSPATVDQAGRYVRFSVDNAFIDEEEQDVVTLQGDIAELTDPPPVLEIPSNEADADRGSAG